MAQDATDVEAVPTVVDGATGGGGASLRVPTPQRVRTVWLGHRQIVGLFPGRRHRAFRARGARRLTVEALALVAAVILLDRLPCGRAASAQGLAPPR